MKSQKGTRIVILEDSPRFQSNLKIMAYFFTVRPPCCSMMMIMCDVFIFVCFFSLKVITRLAGMEEVKSLTIIIPLKKPRSFLSCILHTPFLLPFFYEGEYFSDEKRLLEAVGRE